MKRIHIKNHTTQDSVEIPATYQKVAFIFSLYHEGKLKFKPYWDDNRLLAQATKDIKVTDLKDKLMKELN